DFVGGVGDEQNRHPASARVLEAENQAAIVDLRIVLRSAGIVPRRDHPEVRRDLDGAVPCFLGDFDRCHADPPPRFEAFDTRLFSFVARVKIYSGRCSNGTTFVLFLPSIAPARCRRRRSSSRSIGRPCSGASTPSRRGSAPACSTGGATAAC